MELFVINIRPTFMTPVLTQQYVVILSCGVVMNSKEKRSLELEPLLKSNMVKPDAQICSVTRDIYFKKEMMRHQGLQQPPFLWIFC